jgi:hypothetical protein
LVSRSESIRHNALSAVAPTSETLVFMCELQLAELNSLQLQLAELVDEVLVTHQLVPNTRINGRLPSLRGALYPTRTVSSFS